MKRLLRADCKCHTHRRHISLLRKHRFFTGWFMDWHQYAEGQAHGCLQPGQVLPFYNSIEIEPYSAIYRAPYIGSVGMPPRSGLCIIGFMSYSHSPLSDGMVIGRYTSISRGLQVLDIHHPVNWISSSIAFCNSVTTLSVASNDELSGTPHAMPPWSFTRGLSYPVVGHDVWIGQDVTLSMGVSIGDGAIVAANSVVTKDVPPFAIVAGNPATVRRFRVRDEVIALAKTTQWWNYKYTDFKHLDPRQPELFLRGVADLKVSGQIEEYRPTKLTLPDAWL